MVYRVRQHIIRVMYSNEIVYHGERRNNLCLRLQVVFLCDDQNLEPFLDDPKDALDDVAELCMMKVEQFSMVAGAEKGRIE